MKIRTQLVLACFFLSILPLAGIVLYSYEASRRALERAYRNEAGRVTRQMDRRLNGIRSDLEMRLAELSALPIDMNTGPRTASERVPANVLAVLGDSAPLIDSIRVEPVAAPEPVAPPEPPEPEASSHPERPEVATAHPPGPHGGTDPIVINIPDKLPAAAFGLTEEQRQKSRQLGELSLRLSRESATMSSEEREALAKELQKLQTEFVRDLTAARSKFESDINEAIRARREFEIIRRRERAAEIARRTGTAPPAEVTEAEPQAATPPEAAPLTAAEVAAVAAAAPAARPSAARPPAPASASETTKVVAKPAPVPVAQPTRAPQSRDEHVAWILGPRFKVPMRQEGQVIGNLSAGVRADEVISRVLGSGSGEDEIAFAVDRQGKLYTRTSADRARLERIGISAASIRNKTFGGRKDWIVAVSDDRVSGMKVGVARPIGNDLGDLRNTAATNFGAGVALIFIAMLGIVPVANHLSRDVKLVTAGAERIAQGDLMTRLPVNSKNEFGQLATAFNKMAHDLSHHQQTIIEQERSRKEQEMHQKLLELEYSRKSVELEEARRFQLSMLPKRIPQPETFEVAVFTRTATEVGGDYYDFCVTDDALAVAVGDATGHGAKAGTMVTVVKALFTSYSPDVAPAAFLRDSADKIKRMELGRMAMSFLLARFVRDEVVIAAAGMPPALVHRAASGRVEEVAISGTPLGTLGNDYIQRKLPLAKGDTVLLMSDGLPELLDAAGNHFGYPATVEAFAAAASLGTASSVIEALAQRVHEWRGDQAPNDDVTFVVVRAC